MDKGKNTDTDAHSAHAEALVPAQMAEGAARAQKIARHWATGACGDERAWTPSARVRGGVARSAPTGAMPGPASDIKATAATGARYAATNPERGTLKALCCESESVAGL